MKKEWVFEEIEVECYAGYKGQETPRAFAHLGKRHEIFAILDRWYEEGRDPKAPRHDYFKVRTKDGEIFLLRFTPRYQSWTLCRQVPFPKFSNN
ncbi:MAG: hypothetical protein QME78_01395 [Thermodesulfobacteriota bacterium]|nr:hypothetical protein [Thermodesulfobacteriota bacterium]